MIWDDGMDLKGFFHCRSAVHSHLQIDLYPSTDEEGIFERDRADAWSGFIYHSSSPIS